MPTIGQIRFALSRLRLAGLAVAFTAGFERVDFVPLVFFREGDTLDIAFRFAAMRPFYVSCACASHKLRLWWKA